MRVATTHSGTPIEAAAFAHLLDFVLLFRHSGMSTPKPMVCKGVDLGPDRQRYDLDQDLNASHHQAGNDGRSNAIEIYE